VGSGDLVVVFDGLLMTGANGEGSWGAAVGEAMSQDPDLDNDGFHIVDLPGDAPADSLDDGNPDNEGFGIKQGQASQFNNNEGFLAALKDTMGTADPGDDVFVEMSFLSFAIEGIGNIDEVILDWIIVDEGIVVERGSDTLSLPKGNNEVPYSIALTSGESFDAVYVRTSYAGNPTNEGVRLLDFKIGLPQPTEDQALDWEVTITDFDGDFDVATFRTGIDGTLAEDDGVVADLVDTSVDG